MNGLPSPSPVTDPAAPVVAGPWARLRPAVAALAVLAVCIGGGMYGYHHYLRKLRVAFVGYEDMVWANIDAAAQQTPYAVHRLDRTQLAAADLAGYQMVFLWGMGMNLSPEQVQVLERARQAGTKILVNHATNDLSSSQTNVTAKQSQTIAAYFDHGGQQNHLAMLHYLARELAGQQVDVPPVVKTPDSGLYHTGGRLFERTEEFESHVTAHGPRLPKDAPRVALIGQFFRPKEPFTRQALDTLIRGLENRGMRAYPIFGDRTRELLAQVRPALAIAFPHGRLAQGNAMPEVLAKLDIPCLSALTLFGGAEAWRADERGLAEGLLGQSISMPELDGVIEPLVVIAHEPNERGIRVPRLIADRAERLLDRAANWVKLRRTPNAEKRLAIVYYKAPGLSSLTAAGLEVCPSLLNLLRRLEKEGYHLGGPLPATPEALFALIQLKGKTLGQWAIGSYEKFLAEADPEFVPAATYARWFQQVLSEKRQKEVLALWGKIPGKQMVTQRGDVPGLVVSRIRFGNVVLLPQPTTGGADDDEVRSIHGTNKAPPHFYLGAYLWARFGFRADAIVHFGTHGSLEFTYGKSAGLSRDCWPEILIGDLPHVYPYIINNVGEALVAKRRSCATIVSHLTPPFAEAGLYGELSLLSEKLDDFAGHDDPQFRLEARKTITAAVRKLDLGADLGLGKDELASRQLTDGEIGRLEGYIHQLQQQSMTDGLHVLGRNLEEKQVRSTVSLMLGDRACGNLAKAVAACDPQLAQVPGKALARGLVDAVLDGRLGPESLFTGQEQRDLRAVPAEPSKPGATSPHGHPHAARPTDKGGSPKHSAQASSGTNSVKDKPEVKKMGTTSAALVPPSVKAGSAKPAGVDPAAAWQRVVAAKAQLGGGDRELRRAVLGTIDDIRRYADGLRRSPTLELDRTLQALRAGYIGPSPGGDPLLNPESVPSGRNLYSLNAETTPSEESWRVGLRLTDEILARHRAQAGRYPRRAAFSLWGSEFIRSKGTTIAQILYLLGVRPLRNSRGVVYDVEVIPSAELGRPRIDVLVQTSGQFRDAAASRVTLIDRAVQIVSQLPDEPYPNYVKEGSATAEMTLKERGYAPKDARELATARIFGAADNQSYGTGIMELVEKGANWETEKQVADRYVRNMGGVYRDGQTWGAYRAGLLEAQMPGTELVIHPRSSNTWGPLSLDHVYEFMGGITLSVRNRTGVDPTGYFADQRNRDQGRVSTALGAIREELRTTIWNPKFLQGMQREGPTAAGEMTETVRNMYGWNVMQPSVVDEELWNETYRVFVDDKYKLGMRAYFEKKNPYALQDMTSVMLETARKGLWKASPEMLNRLAELHAELVAQFGAACSYETCGNAKLHEFLAGRLAAPGSRAAPATVAAYQAGLAAVRQSARPLPEVQGMQLDEKMQHVETQPNRRPDRLPTVILAGAVLVAVIVLLAVGSGRRRFRPQSASP